MATYNFSVVEYYYNEVPKKYTCGYCKQSNAYNRIGMWAHTLTVKDYQNLIDRGWRRSGLYCYKPLNNQTCCPLYTIRCEALNFAVTKSQKKIIKKMNKFLKDGDKIDVGSGDNKKERIEQHNHPDDIDIGNRMEVEFQGDDSIKSRKDVINISQNEMMTDTDCDNERLSQCPISTNHSSASTAETVNTQSVDTKKEISTSVPILPNLSDCDKTAPKKAKLIRIERARKRLLAQGKTLEEIEAIYMKKKQKNMAKSIEELLTTCNDAKNKLELKLVRVSSEEFMETLDESVALFKKYQMAIHNDEPGECDKESFLNFLGKSPLQHYAPLSGPRRGYGSFHQQYWLNDKLMAVGVIDILPYCVSSVYFFYDPAYSFLSLGTYSSFMEIKLTRELHKVAPKLEYYYMGYYINNIPKMKYKAKIKPSMLLCPETYVWRKIECCIPKLEENKYSRFNEDPNGIDEDGQIDLEALMQVKCYFRGKRLYRDVLNIRKKFHSEDDTEEVKEYAQLVGKKCAHSMCLYRAC